MNAQEVARADGPLTPYPPGSQLVYLGISGVLHPSESRYRLLRGASPWTNGHSRFESVAALVSAIEDWPEIRIVLTSTLPWRYGLPETLKQLGPLLSERVVGCTYFDLTSQAGIAVPDTRTGLDRPLPCSHEDYWRMNKSEIVMRHVAWARPAAWVAIDDEDILWPEEVRCNLLVLTDGCAGLQTPGAVERLRTLLKENFAR